MEEILQFLDVSTSESIPSGFVIESCGDKYADLAGCYVYCSEYNAAGLKDWVLNNLGVHAEHFATIFDTKPKQAMSFVAMNCNYKSYTDVMVNACGGEQQFLDKYCKRHMATSTDCSAGMSESMNNDSNVDTESVSEHRVMENTNALDMEREAMVKAASELRSEAEKLLQDARKKQEQLEEREKAFDKKVAALDDLFDDEGNLIAFNEPENVIRTLQKLEKLNKDIHIDGLAPDEMLSIEDIPKAVSMLETLSPKLFKKFFISYLEEVKEDPDELKLIRRSVLSNELALFIVQNTTGGSMNG
ncbi:hypothetical protein AALB53_08150 [Lachnospiraceae bacterium 47-T17]